MCTKGQVRSVTLSARRACWGPSGEPAAPALARARAVVRAGALGPPGAADPAGIVLLYRCLPDEPDLSPLAGLLRDAGVPLALPRLLPDGGLEAVGWDGDEASLRPGPRGTSEPAGAALDPASLRAVVVPALAVDPSTGARLGRGGGSYDRFLPLLVPGTPVLAALAGDTELRDLTAVAEAHDVQVGMIALPGDIRPVGG